jgi:cytoskeletal protein RodZ
MEDLGAKLKRAREERGIPLKTIAARTKISVAALEALERNDFTRLPGGIFGRAFVRAYAIEIGLDPETTVADFQEHLTQSEREAAERGQIRAEITPDDREFLARQHRAIRAVQVGAVIVAIVVMAVGVWEGRRIWARAAASRAPAANTAATTAPVTQPASNAAPGTPAPAASSPAASGPERSSTAAGQVSSPLTVDLALVADCWVSVSVDGTQVVSQLLRTGDTRHFDATREVFLDVGNAAALELKINGAPAKSLGGSGLHIQRTITVANAKEMLR